MYRILVVDDEAYVVDWLSMLLESQTDPDLDVCCAYSASEAIQWLERTKIDVVISDISMPGMNGVDLAGKVNLNWPQCKVILLTAYAEFNYAYEAIRNNVVSYILKTEDDDVIIAEVKKAIDIIEDELKNVKLLEKAQKKLDDSMSVIHRELILGILQDSGNHPQLFRQLQDSGLNMQKDQPFIIFICRIENCSHNMEIIERFRLFNAVDKHINQFLGPYFSCYCVDYFYNKLVCLMQKKEEAECHASIKGREIVFVSGLLETVQQSADKTMGIKISFVLNGHQQAFEGLPLGFSAIDRLMKTHNTDNSGFIITSANGKSSTLHGSQIQPLEISMQDYKPLKLFLENGIQKEFIEDINSLGNSFDEHTSWKNQVATQVYYTIAVNLFSYINQQQIPEQTIQRLDIERIFQPQTSGSWYRAFKYLYDVSNTLFDIQQAKEDFSGNIISFLQKYIKEHIAQDLSLTKLSEVSGYNASYLSRIYSECTGETLNEYIRQEKMVLILKLMDDKNLNIGDIAEKAGFEYRTYFNRFIKKATGMSPREFRENRLHKQD